jgi:class 3 adenylate cyclase
MFECSVDPYGRTLNTPCASFDTHSSRRGAMRPTGTVTLLFSDIDGSTRLLRSIGVQRYENALAQHRSLLRDAFARHAGYEVDTAGDSFFFAFGRALDAVQAALDAQCALAAHAWADGEAIRVRMGIHTCEVTEAGSGYVGMGVHRAARICAAVSRRSATPIKWIAGANRRTG